MQEKRREESYDCGCWREEKGKPLLIQEKRREKSHDCACRREGGGKP